LDTAELLQLLWHCVYFAVNLMGLLKWRDNPKDLERYLRLFMKVDGEEIVKVEFFWCHFLGNDSVCSIEK